MPGSACVRLTAGRPTEHLIQALVKAGAYSGSMALRRGQMVLARFKGREDYQQPICPSAYP
jgi:hypothetical protein